VPAVRLSSDGAMASSLAQAVPAARVEPNRSYRVSWMGRLSRRSGAASSTGQVMLVSTCPDGDKLLARHTNTRGDAFSQFDLVGTTPAARCGLEVRLSLLTPAPAGMAADFTDIRLTFADKSTPSAQPTYPLEVRDVPQPVLRFTYSGSGKVQAYVTGRWWILAVLAPSSGRVTTLAVPGWIQGRNINLDYHAHHVGEETALYEQTGDTAFRDAALRWMVLAPEAWHYETRLRRPVTVRPIAS
jgi:hypothetical protein